MYSKTFESKRISIRNYHMEKLLERFDYTKFELMTYINSSTMERRNKVPCVLCKAFSSPCHDCGKCPLAQFRPNNLGGTGCGYIFTKLLPGSVVLQTYVGSIVYNILDKRPALENLKTITKFLKSFKKE